MEIRVGPNIEKFISALEKPTLAKVLRTIDLLEKFGRKLGMPHSKKISSNIFELRTRGHQETRIFYCFHNGAAYLLHGFIKKTQKTPKKELDAAKNKFTRLTLL